MVQQKVKIISNERLSSNSWLCCFESPVIARQAKPGEFVNVRVSDNLDPLLRRPFSINRVKGNKVWVLYDKLGKGTEILSKRGGGEFVDVIGPLGKGFTPRFSNGEKILSIIVAGGMGAAPLVFLAEKIMKGNSKKAKGKVKVLLGAKTRENIICEKEFRRLGCDVKIATDDGSRGRKGYVSELFESLLRISSNEILTIYSCGPKPMLKEVARISGEYNVPAQLSLEEHMSCAIGACLGCVVKVKCKKSKGKSDFEYQRVCKEGPVFNAADIIWE